MKLKAAATRTLPPNFLEALNSRAIADGFDAIIMEFLSVRKEDIGPATHFVQETDLTIPSGIGLAMKGFNRNGIVGTTIGGVNVAFTMVSNNRYRSDQNFADALAAIRTMYVDLIHKLIPKQQYVQLFCVLNVEKEIEGFDGKPVRLLELPAELIEGSEGVAIRNESWAGKPGHGGV